MKKRLSAICPYLLIVSLFIIPFLIFSGSINGYSEPVRGVTDTTIKIGAIMDQTGPIAGDMGLPVTEAIKHYIRHVNEGGGIFGRKVKLLIEDDRYSIPAGIAAFKKLLFKDRIFLLLGPGSTGEARALFRKIQKNRIPSITGAPDEAMVNPLKRYIFMIFNVYDDQLGVIFEYIKKDLKASKANVTFVYFDAESGKIALESARKWAAFYDLGLDTEIINMGAIEANSQVLSIKRKKSTHVVIHHGSPGTALLVRALRRFGLDLPVFGTAPSCMEDTVRMGGSASKKYIGAHMVSSWYEDFEGMKKLRKITLKYNPGTERPYRSKIYTLGWLMCTVLFEGLERAGKDLNAEGLVEAWESIRNMDTGGISGSINFSSTNHKGLQQSRLYKADPERGRFIPITGWRKTPEIK